MFFLCRGWTLTEGGRDPNFQCRTDVKCSPMNLDGSPMIESQFSKFHGMELTFKFLALAFSEDFIVLLAIIYVSCYL